MLTEVTLQTVGSPVQFGGRARVNKDILEQLEVDEGDLVVVSSDNKDILVSLFSDELMDEDKIKLRKDDLRKLKTSEEKNVTLRKHQSFLNKNFLDNLL
ncbi:MAG: hypothetical protein ACQESD_01870 [Thermoplasmatota archaeon]